MSHSKRIKASAVAEKELSKPEFNLCTKDEVKRIKDLLKLEHRTEEQWTVIKDILNSRSLVVMEPFEPTFLCRAVEHIFLDGKGLVAFTNGDDCVNYIKAYNIRSKKERNFLIGSLPFELAVDVAEKYKMDLYIDMQKEINGEKFLCYVHGQERIKAMMWGKE